MARIQIRIDSVLVDGVAAPDPHTFRRELEDTLADLARRHRGPYPAGAVAHLHAAQLDASAVAGADVAHRVWDSIVADRTAPRPTVPSRAASAPTPSAAAPSRGAGP